MRVHPIPPDYIDTASRFLKPLLTLACSRGGGDITPDRILADARERKAQLWVPWETGNGKDAPCGVVATSIQTWGGGKAVRILCMGGRRARVWLPLAHEEIRKFALNEGAHLLVTEGRKGWGRVFGLKPARYVYEMRV